MSDEGKPRDEVITYFHAPPQLTKAVTRPGEIRFEVEVPGCKDRPNRIRNYVETFEEGLRDAFSGRQGRTGPTQVFSDEHDKSSFIIVYTAHGKRDLQADRRTLMSVLAEGGVSMMTDDVTEAMCKAFAALGDHGPEKRGSAVSAELARRGARKGQGGRGPS